MKDPKQSYEEKLKETNVYENSYRTFFDKYIKRKPAEYFLQLNEGETMSRRSNAFFVPGRIYTFEYDPLYKDTLSYYDTRPIIMVQKIEHNKNTKNVLLHGINFSFLPEKIKVAVLSYYYSQFKNEYKSQEDAHWKGAVAKISQRIVSFLIGWISQIKVFEKQNINYNFAYRKYIIQRIQNPVLIEYDDWDKIPFIRSKDINGTGLMEIIKEYIIKNKK
jgi:hypothetical protein